jgi:hypothetical protein
MRHKIIVGRTHCSVDEAEERSGLSRWTWRKYARDRKVDSVKAGKRLLIPVAEIDRIMQEGTRPRQ